MPPWSFLTRHAQLLLVLADSPRLRVRDLAPRLGVTQRAVMKLLGDLETSGHLERQRDGRCNVYAIDWARRSPDSADAGLTVGDLLRVRRQEERLDLADP